MYLRILCFLILLILVLVLMYVTMYSGGSARTVDNTITLLWTHFMSVNPLNHGLFYRTITHGEGHPQHKVEKSQEFSCMGRLKIFRIKGKKQRSGGGGCSVQRSLFERIKGEILDA